MRDLEEFLQGQAQHGLKPLGLGGLMVPDGSHMTHFYSGKDEALEVSAAYVIEGLKHGELVLAVMPPERGRELLASIERQGHPVEIGLKSGQLFVSEGMDSPEEMIRYLASFAKMAGQFRLVGDGVWAIRKGWGLAALRTLEEAGNSLRSREGKLFLCQYSLEDFSGAHIMMAAEAHTHVIYKGRLEKSLYYRQNRAS
jgi:transcriptional repressor of dcmA and dcmR